MMRTSKDIDKYIERLPVEVQQRLQSLRQTISKAAPDAEEMISYGMPAFRLNGILNGILVYFAAFKKHIGFYPTPSGIAEFKKELSRYNTSRGSVQFPFDKPLPLTLVSRIVKFRVLENMGRVKKKRG